MTGNYGEALHGPTHVYIYLPNYCDVPTSLFTVHGFANASYDVKEGGFLNTTFKLNVKGTTSLALVILGTITSEAGTASE